MFAQDEYFVHAVVSQVPDRGRHLVRYYGIYANRSRKTWREMIGFAEKKSAAGRRDYWAGRCFGSGELSRFQAVVNVSPFRRSGILQSDPDRVDIFAELRLSRIGKAHEMENASDKLAELRYNYLLWGRCQDELHRRTGFFFFDIRRLPPQVS